MRSVFCVAPIMFMYDMAACMLYEKAASYAAPPYPSHSFHHRLNDIRHQLQGGG